MPDSGEKQLAGKDAELLLNQLRILVQSTHWNPNDRRNPIVEELWDHSRPGRERSYTRKYVATFFDRPEVPRELKALALETFDYIADGKPVLTGRAALEMIDHLRDLDILAAHKVAIGHYDGRGIANFDIDTVLAHKGDNTYLRGLQLTRPVVKAFDIQWWGDDAPKPKVYAEPEKDMRDPLVLEFDRIAKRMPPRGRAAVSM